MVGFRIGGASHAHTTHHGADDFHVNLGARPLVFFYRDKHQREIDLLIEDNGALHPVEIKKGAHLDDHDVHCFRLLDRPGAPVGTGALVSQYPQVAALSDSALAIPASRI